MEEKKEIQIELSAEVAEGIYSNLSIISHAPSEFVIDFIRMTPGAPKAPVKSRIILTAEHAKRLLFALQDNIRKYEAQFGPIQMNDPQRGGMPPFMGSRRGSLTTDRRRILSNSLSFRV